jgi:hypothetical protein
LPFGLAVVVVVWCVKNDKHVMKIHLFVANIVRNVNQGLIDSGKEKSWQLK